MRACYRSKGCTIFLCTSHSVLLHKSLNESFSLTSLSGTFQLRTKPKVLFCLVHPIFTTRWASMLWLFELQLCKIFYSTCSQIWLSSFCLQLKRLLPIWLPVACLRSTCSALWTNLKILSLRTSRVITMAQGLSKSTQMELLWLAGRTSMAQTNTSS